MKRWRNGFLIAFWLSAAAAFAQPRLAIVAEDPSLEATADALTAQFTGQDQFVLLERDQIQKVFREQSLSAANRDDLKLGEVLGADGLLVLEREQRGEKETIAARLIVVKPGVLLDVEDAPWPLENPEEWRRILLPRVISFTPKLAVLKKDAIPLSILNLRSALNTEAEHALERQLTLSLIHRLTHEPEIFVMERQHMDQALFEEELKPEEQSSFWTGRYLLEGTIDQQGFDSTHVTIDARLRFPGDSTTRTIEVTGPRNDLTKVVESVATNVLAALERSSAATEWRPTEEADRFFEEAKWAHRWGLWREAQAAAESSWALGPHSQELAMLRVRSYLDEGPSGGQAGSPPRLAHSLAEPRWLVPLTRAGQAFVEGIHENNSMTESHDHLWLDLGLQLINNSGAALDGFYQNTQARLANEPKLEELRSATHGAATILRTNFPNRTMRGGVGYPSLNMLKWADGGLWFERPEDALVMYRELLESGFRPRGQDLPHLVEWAPAARQRLPALVAQFANELRASTNEDLQMEGLYLTFELAPLDSFGAVGAVQRQLCDSMWSQRRTLFNGRPGASLLERMEESFRFKSGAVPGRPDWDAFCDLRRRLRKDYLTNATTFNTEGFIALFEGDYSPNLLSTIRHPDATKDIIIPFQVAKYSKADADELRPLLENFRSRLNLSGRTNELVSLVIGGLYDRDQGAAFRWRTNAPAHPMPFADLKPLVIEFTPWHMAFPGIDESLRPMVEFCLFKNGKLWAQLRYFNPALPGRVCRTAFASVDPRNGETDIFPFPESLGVPAHFFDVNGDALFVFSHDAIQRCSLISKQWETVPGPVQDRIPPGENPVHWAPVGHPVPAHGNIQLVERNNHLYLGAPETVLEVQPADRAVQVLASARRRPAVNQLDELNEFDSLFFVNGQLGVVANRRLFALSSGGQSWNEIPVPLSPPSGPVYDISPFQSEEGTLLLETEMPAQQHLFAIWNDAPEARLLLEQRYARHGIESEALKKARPPQWDWPAPFLLYSCLIMPDKKSLWVMHPQRVRNWRGILEYLTFPPDGGGRHATLLRFEPGSRAPSAIALRFECHGKAFDVFNAPHPLLSGTGDPAWQATIPPFGFNTPDGLIILSPESMGDWLIRKSVLEQSLKSNLESARNDAN